MEEIIQTPKNGIHTLKDALYSGFKKTLKTLAFIFKIYIPVFLLVKLLAHFSLLDHVSAFFVPMMAWFGLPGEAALVLIFTNFINIYGGLAALDLSQGVAIGNTLLTAKQITTLAVMMLFSHSLIIETSIFKGLGVARWKQVLLRVGAMILVGILLKVVL